MVPKTTPNILDNILQEVNSLKILFSEFKLEKEKTTAIRKTLFKYMPVQDIFDLGLMTRSTFYKFIKEGKYQLYKLGGLSYVDREEFENAFHKVKMYPVK